MGGGIVVKIFFYCSKSSLNMVLQMKLKISDKPVKSIALTRYMGEEVVLTGAGNYGDEEAILRWRREKNSVNF